MAILSTATARVTGAIAIGALLLACSGGDDGAASSSTARPGAPARATPCAALPPASVSAALHRTGRRIGTEQGCAYKAGNAEIRLDLLPGRTAPGRLPAGGERTRPVDGVGDEAVWTADPDLLGGALAVRTGNAGFVLRITGTGGDPLPVAKKLASRVVEELAPLRAEGVPPPVPSLRDVCAALDPRAVGKLLGDGSQFAKGTTPTTCVATGRNGVPRAVLHRERASGASAADLSRAWPQGTTKAWRRHPVDGVGDAAVFLEAPNGKAGVLLMVWGGQRVRITVSGPAPGAVAEGLARALGAAT